MKELGYIDAWPFGMLRAVTLWKFGPFRRILYRDVSGKCYKYGPVWTSWLKGRFSWDKRKSQ